MSVALVESGAALESMRNSDFDVCSAYGEVIDNSIQADATEIRVLIDYKPALARGQREPIQFVAFGDNGTGMPTDILHRCLQLGYSSRYNDRTGIGRFGVGAILAAINQCEKVEIYSKIKDSKEWQYTYIDLELITAGKQQSIPEPKQKAVPPQLLPLVSGQSGTLVIWSKYDRQPDDATQIKKDFTSWAGRTYRRKIWNGVKLWVNNETVFAIDPLYVSTKNTRFPDDHKAFEYEPMKLEWPIPSEDRHGNKSVSTIVIRMSLLPTDFRQRQGAGGTNLVKERFIDENEGISILRNDREVFYGHIPYWPGGFDEIDRWWGCEISFHAELDRAFTVKNIKRGALPIKPLKDAIHHQIEPTRRTALESVRELWKNTRAEEKISIDPGLDTGHSDAEQAAKDTQTPISLLDREKNSAAETDAFTDKWLKDADEQHKAAWKAKFQSQPFTILDDQWKGPEFFETVFLGGKSILKYNMRHVFFAEIEQIRERLASPDADNPEARRLKALIDLLLIAYAKSEAMFDSTIQLPAERFIEQLRMNWGNYLSNYIETFKTEVVGDS
jgi:Histidine kinase-, DNA gyrase B-, and HSP90-like ATPase